MRYVRDIPRDLDAASREVEEEHVRQHLAGAADPDDDPTTRAAEVGVWTIEHPEDRSLLRIVGELDAEPVADYLTDGYDPLAGVDPDLYAAEVEAAQRDEEVLARGQA